jgi:hypothetical protein
MPKSRKRSVQKAKNHKRRLRLRKEVQKWKNSSLTDEEVRAILAGEKVQINKGRNPRVRFRQEQIKKGILSLDQSGRVSLPRKLVKQLKDIDLDKTDLVEHVSWQRIPVRSDLGRLYQYAAKRGKDGVITTLYHGTRIENIEPIVKDGFRVTSRWGMLGSGVYFGKLQKASNYSDCLVLEVAVVLGRCRRLEDVEKINSSDNSHYDSLHLPEGDYARVYSGRLRNEEWVVRDPKLTEVVAILQKKTSVY